MLWFLIHESGLHAMLAGVAWLHMIGAGCLAGVGFTMSIFIVTVAFDASHLQSVKLNILIASSLSAIIGMLILANVPRAKQSSLIEAKG